MATSHAFPSIRTRATLAEADLARATCLEERRDVIARFAAQFSEKLMDIVADAGGDPDYIESWPEKMSDDITIAFSDAIDKRDDRKSTDSKAAAKADFARAGA